MPVVRSLPPALLLRNLRDAGSACFRPHQRKHSRDEEGPRLQRKSWANTALDGQRADSERRNRRDRAPNVVAKADGRRADFTGKNFAGDRGVSRKKSRSKKSHEWPEKQQQGGAARHSVDWYQHGSN